MRRPSRHEIPMGNCPHPGCDVPIRLLHNRRANTLIIYHGEDELAEISPTPGHGWGDLAESMTPGSPEYATIVQGTGVALAYGIAELHVRGAA